MMLLVEAVAAAVLGLGALWLVLRPLVHPTAVGTPGVELLEPEETAKGIALAALKDIEFDRETGKLSDADYEVLKAKYTNAALQALRAEAAREEPASSLPSGVVCTVCGPRPEPDAVFCSTCGRPLPRRVAA